MLVGGCRYPVPTSSEGLMATSNPVRNMILEVCFLDLLLCAYFCGLCSLKVKPEAKGLLCCYFLFWSENSGNGYKEKGSSNVAKEGKLIWLLHLNTTRSLILGDHLPRSRINCTSRQSAIERKEGRIYSSAPNFYWTKVHATEP